MVTTELQEFIRRVNDAFVRHDTAFFDANLADDVRWTMVGSPAIEGKAAFIAEVMSMAEGRPRICRSPTSSPTARRRRSRAR